MITLFYNFKIFNINVGELLNKTDLNNLYSFEVFKDGQHFNKIKGFFFNLKCITLIEIENFLFFYNASLVITNNILFKKKLIYFFSFFFNESLIYLFFTLISIEELYFLFLNKFFSFLVLFKLIKNFNKLLFYQIIKLYIYFFNLKNLFIFKNFIDLKSFLLTGVYYYDNNKYLYNYFINNLNLDLLKKKINNLFFYENIMIFLFNNYIYKFLSFYDIILVYLKNLIENIYKIFDYYLNNYYTLGFFKNYITFLSLKNFEISKFNISTYYYSFFFFLHEVNLIFKVFWILFFKIFLYLKSKKIDKKILIFKFLLWKLRINLFSFLNFYKLKFNFFNFQFFYMYIVILYNFFRKIIFINFFFFFNFNFFKFLNYFLIKFLNYILYKSLFYTNVLKNFIYIYSDFFLLNFSKYFNFLNVFNFSNFFNYKNLKKKNDVNVFFFLKNFYISIEFKKNLFFNFINLKYFLNNGNLNFFFFFFLTKRSLFLYGFSNTINVKLNFYNFGFFKLNNITPYYIILKNFFSFSKIYLYLPLSYRINSRMEDFFSLLTEDYIVEGFEGFHFDLNFDLFYGHYSEYDYDTEDYLDMGNEYYIDVEDDLIYEEQFYLFDIYDELKSLNSYTYFLFQKKYNLIYSNSYVGIKNTENTNIFFDFLFLKKSPLYDKNQYIYKDYISSEPLAWSYWSFFLFENDLESYIDLKTYNYKENFPLTLKNKRISSFFFSKEDLNKNKNNSFNFFDFFVFSNYSSNLNFESMVYLTGLNSFNYFLLFLKLSIFRPIGFLTEKWWWWNILKYDFKNYFSYNFLFDYLFPKNFEESLFLTFFYNLVLLSNLKTLTPNIEYKKLELFYDTFIDEYFNNLNQFFPKIINSSFDKNVLSLFYNNYLKNYIELIFYFDYIELLNFVYEFSYYLDISYYKMFFFLNKIEKLLNFFISQTIVNLFYNYYEPFSKKDRFFFFELLFLNIFSMFYKYFQFELEYMDESSVNFIDYERSRYFIEIIDDMYLPTIEQYEKAESFSNFINARNYVYLKNRDYLKEADLNFFSVQYLNFLNDPYFLFSNKFNISFSFPEIVFFDLYDTYSLNFYNIDDEELLEFNLLKNYKFFEFNTQDFFSEPDTNDMSINDPSVFLSIFDYMFFPEGFFYDSQYLFFLEMSFSNYFIGETYNNYLNRLDSFYSYNLTLTSNLSNYLQSNSFFFNNLVNLVSFLPYKNHNNFFFDNNFNSIFFFKNFLFFEKVYFYYFNIFSFKIFLNRERYVNFFSYLIFLLFFSILMVLKKLSNNLLLLKIYLLLLLPLYLIFLLFKFVKKIYKINIFKNFNFLLNLSLPNLIKLILLVFKELKLFIYYFLFCYSSFNNLYFFFFKYYFLFKNLFNLTFFSFIIKFIKLFLNLKYSKKNILNIFDSNKTFTYLYNKNFSSFRSVSSLINLYKFNFNNSFFLFDNVYSIFNWLYNGNNFKINNFFDDSIYLKKNDYQIINKKIFSNLIFFNNYFFLDTINISNLDLELNNIFLNFFNNKEIYNDNFLDDLDTSLTDTDNYDDYIFDETSDFKLNLDDLDTFDNKPYDEWSSEFVVGDIADEYETDERESFEIDNSTSIVNEEFNYELSSHNFFNYVDLTFNDVFENSVTKVNDTFFFKNYLRGYNLIKKFDNISLYYYILLKKFIFFMLPYYKKFSYINYFNLYWLDYNNYLRRNSNKIEKKQLNFLLNKKNLSSNDKYSFLNIDSSLHYFLDNNFIKYNELYKVNKNLNKVLLDKEIYYSLNYMYTYELNENLDFFVDGLDDREEEIYLSSFLENKYNSELFINLSNFNKFQKKKINLSLVLLLFFCFNITTFKFFFFKLYFFELIEMFFFLFILKFVNFNFSFLFFKYIYLRVYVFFYTKLKKFFLIKKQIILTNNIIKFDIYKNFFSSFYNLKINNVDFLKYFDLVEFLVSNNLFILNGFILKSIFLLKTFYKSVLSIFSYFLFSKYVFWLIFMFKYLKLPFNKNFFYLKISKFFFLLKNYEKFLFFNSYKLFKIYTLYSVNEVMYYLNNIYLVNNYNDHIKIKEITYLKYIFYFEFFSFLFIIIFYLFIFFLFFILYGSYSPNFSFYFTTIGDLETQNNKLMFFGIDMLSHNSFKGLLNLYYSSLTDTFWMIF